MSAQTTATYWIEQSQQFEAELGRQYPPAFLADLAFQGAELVQAWLRANGAPAEICELAEQTAVLNVLMPAIEAHSLNDIGASQVLQLVPGFLAKLINFSGCPEWPELIRPTR
jgi:hypothetical protein